MTIAEIRATEKPFLIPKDLAPVLGCQPYAINVAAKQAPEMLGFPVCVIGTRVKVPTAGFLRWYDGQQCQSDSNGYKGGV